MAVIFEKHIELAVGTSPGLFTVSTTSSSYVEPSYKSYRRYDPDNYPSPTVYYEAVIKVSAGTGYASLFDSGGSAVSSTEVTTTSSSISRVRSGSLSLSADDYHTRIKNNASNTCTYYGSRIIALHNSGSIAKTETQITVYKYSESGSNSSSYVEASSIGNSYFLYTSANWDGTVAIYFDATIKTSAGTGYAQLHTYGGSAVSGAEVSTTSTLLVRVRSGSISLSNATAYGSRIKNNGTNTTNITDAAVIIQQIDNPTKSESHLPTGNCFSSSASGASFVEGDHRINYDSGNWNLDSVAWYMDYSYNSNVGNATLELYAITSAARVTGSNITPGLNVVERQRSSSLTMPTSQDLEVRCASQSGTVYSCVHNLIAIMTWTNSDIPKDVTDSGSGSDAITVLALVPETDSASGADAISVLAEISLSDLGAGVDTLAILAMLGVDDSGSGVDQEFAGIQIDETDEGSGSDVVEILYKEITTSDSGSGTDTILIVFKDVFATDSGSGTDTIGTEKTVIIEDSGVGVDSVTDTAFILKSDIGEGLDQVNILGFVNVTEEAVGVDGVAVLVQVPIADSAVGVDTIITQFVKSLLKFKDMTLNKPEIQGVR